jgi:hypothetical protein
LQYFDWIIVINIVYWYLSFDFFEAGFIADMGYKKMLKGNPLGLPFVTSQYVRARPDI